jgi:hypothetical protein
VRIEGGDLGFSLPGKGLAKKLGRGIKKGGKFTVKMHVRAFLALNKAALKGFCLLPGPAKTAAISAALTASTGGAGGAAAPVVSGPAADAICRAMRSGKAADMSAAQKALERDGVAFEPSIWDQILDALGLR